MSGIKDVYDPGHPSRCSLDVEWLSTALLSPDLGIEVFHAPLPEVETDDPTAPAVEPISSCRPPQRGKRYVYVWHCCACDKASIPIMEDNCPDCRAQRCPHCRVDKIRVQ